MEIQEDKRALRRGQLERKRNRGEQRNSFPHRPQRVESICEAKGQKEWGTSWTSWDVPGGEGQHHPHTALAGCWDGGTAISWGIILLRRGRIPALWTGKAPAASEQQQQQFSLWLGIIRQNIGSELNLGALGHSQLLPFPLH